LAVDSEYFFHLVLRTSAGTYASDKVTVKTHKMTDLSGITVCPGIMSAGEREQLEATIQRIGAKPIQDHVRIDTTHFVCTEGRGQGWERAQEMNIPIVRPDWLEACEQEGRIVGVRMYYLSADTSLRPARSKPSHRQPQSPVTTQEQHTIASQAMPSPHAESTHEPNPIPETPANDSRPVNQTLTGRSVKSSIGSINDEKNDITNHSGSGSSDADEYNQEEERSKVQGNGESFTSVPL